MTREMEERRTARLNLVRTADRSEKIRTYNYAQVIAETFLFFDSICHLLATEGSGDGPPDWVDIEEPCRGDGGWPSPGDSGCVEEES